MGAGRVLKHRVALAGNPNVGKSSIFNRLTGLRHHTGNWAGKTVQIAAGRRGDLEFVDLPGIYSLSGGSEDARLAAQCLQSGQADCVVVVCDATALERNLILALQILQLCDRVVVCVNLADEARRQGITVDIQVLSQVLGVPVVLTAAPRGEGIAGLLAQIRQTICGPAQEKRDLYSPILQAQELAARCVRQETPGQESWRRTLDSILVSRRYGVPILLSLLFVIVALTVWGANLPGKALETLFGWGYDGLVPLFAGLPGWLTGLVLDGMYATAARVLAVMLPPMTIFFVLFTVLEDVGYLPRMAFLLDGAMGRCGGCGKQALTLCMGLGCNAVGVMGCRIIDSPRQRLQAIVTNAMVPCNGRFPALIFLAAILAPPGWAALVVAGAVALGILGAMAASGVLSRTALRHKPSIFLLELPPLRRPRMGDILLRSLLDRVTDVALRAICVAAPAGAVLWALSNWGFLGHVVAFLEPLGRLLGMNGAILVGFLFALPANELFLPVMALCAAQLTFTWPMALCTLVFTLFHWPCSTTLLTIYKETGSIKQTAAAFFLPTAVGMGLCMLLNGLLQYFC